MRGELPSQEQTTCRGIRGGYFVYSSGYLHSSVRDFNNPRSEGAGLGFRVASVTPSSPPAVPEPSMMVIGTLFGIGGLMAKRRMKK